MAKEDKRTLRSLLEVSRAHPRLNRLLCQAPWPKGLSVSGVVIIRCLSIPFLLPVWGNHLPVSGSMRGCVARQSGLVLAAGRVWPPAVLTQPIFELSVNSFLFPESSRRPSFVFGQNAAKQFADTISTSGREALITPSEKKEGGHPEVKWE